MKKKIATQIEVMRAEDATEIEAIKEQNQGITEARVARLLATDVVQKIELEKKADQLLASYQARIREFCARLITLHSDWNVDTGH
jgi:hypothetical protein